MMRSNEKLPFKVDLIPANNLNSLVDLPARSLTKNKIINNAIVPGIRDSQNMSLIVKPRMSIAVEATTGPTIAPA